MAQQQKVSMDTIASCLNVSKVTVSKALNDKEGVSEELREIIKKKAEELGYHINVMAKGLKQNRTYNIGVLIAERYVQASNTYYLEIYTKITKEIASFGYTVILEILSSEDEAKKALPKMYLSGKVDGIIVIGECSHEYLKIYQSLDTPVLFFDFTDSEILVDSIITDNNFSGLQITKLLINSGHTKIGFIGNIYSTSSIKDRFLGYYRALLDAKIPLDYNFVISDRDEDGVLKAIELPSTLPTAFVCNNDQGAYYLCQKLIKQGYNIPDDISIVTFDNSIYSELSPVKLTTVDSNADEMVRVAIKVITKKIEKRDKVYDRIFIKGKIIERNSVKILGGK